MKLGLILAVAVALVISAGSLNAGGWRGGVYVGPRGGVYAGARYAPGCGWYGRPYYRPAVGIGFVVPPVYPAVYVPRPAPVYTSSYDPVLVSAQTRLSKLGYYRGAIDGDFGPQTSAAIRNFQIDSGLPVTGRLDSRTLRSLGV